MVETIRLTCLFIRISTVTHLQLTDAMSSTPGSGSASKTTTKMSMDHQVI